MMILIGSNNAKKLGELQRLLDGLDVELTTPAAAGLDIEPIEDGTSFEENSLKKACEFAAVSGFACIADDSGLEVAALGGRPGIYSARYGGEDIGDSERTDLLLAELDGIADRSARFVCVASFVTPEGMELIARGECRGEILTEKRGPGGFGYDPVFYIPQEGRTFGEMTFDEKAKYSHRSRALELLRKKLNNILEDN